MVGGDESSRPRMANEPAVLASYQPLLTALLVSDCDVFNLIEWSY